MDLSELLKKGRIRKTESVSDQAQALLQVAKRDLDLGKELLERTKDGSLMHSYNSILQCSRALMAHYGYRATEEEHKTPLDFVSAVLPEFENPVNLDKLRKKRHLVTYEAAETTSKYEAEHAIKMAEKLYSLVLAKISQGKP